MIRTSTLFGLLLLTLYVNSASIRRRAFKNDSGDPLFLTPLIEAGQIDEAQAAAKVNFSEFQDIESYSGFLTVDAQLSSNLFFWFFPAINNYPDAPVILWLQGGPGSSSMFGLFNEHGPFQIKEPNKLELRPYSWNKDYSVVYLDQPVGTGFSFTNDTKGYARNQDDVATNIYSALLQFFQLFPDLQKNEFFIFGESYAGKFVPSICNRIHEENPDASQKINLQGLALGDGLSDPINQLDYSDYLYEAGLVDDQVRDQMKTFEDLTRKNIEAEDWAAATNSWSEVLTLYDTASGSISEYNYVNDSTNIEFYPDYLERSDVRKAIHVGSKRFDDLSTTAHFYLNNDMMKSVADLISNLLSNYRMLTYNGQLDVIVAYPLTDNYLHQLNFSSADEFAKAKRHIWRVGGDVAGYFKTAGNLTEIMVRDAGHMVPGDQPVWAYDMVQRFISNKPFN